MEFIGRQEETKQFRQTTQLSRRHSQMTVITGRRRIGKTRLIQESLQDERYLYLFVGRKAEALLCKEFITEIKRVLPDSPTGAVTEFTTLFGWLCKFAEREHLIVAIDEFQEFLRLNPAIYADVQRLWDLHKESMRMHLVLSGSVQSMMRRIFDNYHEPLFGRVTNRLRLQPFGPSLLRDTLRRHAPDATARDLLTFYAITGGVPKYVELLLVGGALTHESMFDAIFHPNSLFIEEGRLLLLEDFGKEYANYFSVLSILASGKTDRKDIMSILQKEVGGYLQRLREDYAVIDVRKPLFSKPQTKNVRYYVSDHFLRFWFRFIFWNQTIIEAGNFGDLRQIAERDWTTFCGWTLERYYHAVMIEQQAFTAIGSYWERGNKNEVDLVAYNELTKKAIIAEVKMQRKEISLNKLREKSAKIERELPGYAIEYVGYDLEGVWS